MISIPRSSKLFFALIAAAALFVAVLGAFAPTYLATLFAWVSLPPLHARFIGAIYAFGAVYMLLCLRAQDLTCARWALLLITLWTGMLGLISLLNLGAFDLAQLPAQIWFASYTVYPLIGIGLLVATRQQQVGKDTAQRLPAWAQRLLWVQGGLVSLLAVCLFVAPAITATAWPWPVTALLAQLYAGPLLAYGVGSMLCAYQGTWAGASALVPAMLIFTAGALVASVMHRNLFSASELPDWVWFGALTGATIGLGAIMAGFVRPAAHAPATPSQVS